MRGGSVVEMLLWALAAVLLLAGRGFELFAPEFVPSERDPAVLRVVTWNVGGAAEGEPHLLLAEHTAAVAESLAALEPDLVFLQEIPADGELLDQLVALLGEPWTVRRGRRGVVALSTDGELVPWPVPLTRSVAVRVEFAGRSLAALGIHASAYSAHDRNREIGPTLDALLEQPADGHLYAGDLNLDLDLDKRGDLFTSDFYADVETYNYVASRLRDAARGRGATAEPDRRLDYLFVSAELEVRAAGPWKGRRVGTMDHDPLVVDLVFR